MPELPEVETVKRGLEPALLGRVITAIDLRRKDLRFAWPKNFAATMTGARVEALERRAKYILIHCSNGQSIISHLGMTGRFTIRNRDGSAFEPGAFYHGAETQTLEYGAHDHLVISLDDGTCIIYNDARRFGFIDMVETTKRGDNRFLKDIGVEPLGNGFNAEHLRQKFSGKKAPLKAALLDQRVVAGLGNIYVSEALYRAKLKPTRKALSLVKSKSVDARLDDLARHIKDILTEAILAGGSTLQDFQGASGEMGSFQQRFLVYDREGEPCFTTGCSHVIKRIVQSGRSTFYCPSCQK